eukprot:gene8289-10185_t
MSLETSLHYFIIYNRALGQKEGTEHEKILYFHPPTITIGEQTNLVGLTEGYVLFSKSFSEKHCETIRTMKQTISLYNPEPDIWMIMSLSNPAGPLGKDGKTREYQEDEVDDIVLHTVLEQTYQLWTLFNGSILSFAQRRTYDVLRRRLESFLKPYLLQIQFDKLDLFTSLDGICFLPLNKNVYLKILGYVNSIEVHFQTTLSTFRFGALLYKDTLIWSSLKQNTTSTIYNYIVQMIRIGIDASNGPCLTAINTNGDPCWHTKGSKK